MSTPRFLRQRQPCTRTRGVPATRTPEGTALGTIAADMHLNKATAYNTLATLRERNWAGTGPSHRLLPARDGIAPIAAYRTSTRHMRNTSPYLENIGRQLPTSSSTSANSSTPTSSTWTKSSQTARSGSSPPSANESDCR